MTLETFFEKFALFADAPDAVAKMRELVLELAFTGRLSGKIPNIWEARGVGRHAGSHLFIQHSHGAPSEYSATTRTKTVIASRSEAGHTGLFQWILSRPMPRPAGSVQSAGFAATG